MATDLKAQVKVGEEISAYNPVRHQRTASTNYLELDRRTSGSFSSSRYSLKEEYGSFKHMEIADNVHEWDKREDFEDPTPRRGSFSRIKQEELNAKVAAWLQAKTCELNNRYKREEAKIFAWEEHQRAKARIILNKAEMRLEEEKAKAIEKMQNEFARAHKEKEEQTAIKYAEKELKMHGIYEEGKKIKATKKVPTYGCFSHFS